MRRFKDFNASELNEVSAGLIVSDPGEMVDTALTSVYYPGKGVSSFAFSPLTGKSPVERYFDTNQADSEAASDGMIGLLNLTPGQSEGEGEEPKDGEEESPIRGMNTDALNMGPAGASDEESRKNIQKAAIARLKDARKRWKFLKSWVKSFDVDGKTQAKIVGLDAIAGINAPSIAKMADTYILPSGKRAEI